MSTTARKCPKGRIRTQRKRAGEPPPDLSPILHALYDAEALVSVAHQVIVEGEDYGSEECVLWQGVEALDRLGDQLEDAQFRLARFLKANNLVADTS